MASGPTTEFIGQVAWNRVTGQAAWNRVTGQADWNRMNRAGSLEQNKQGKQSGTKIQVRRPTPEVDE